MFQMTSNIHEENTRSASHGLSTKPSCNTSKYGTNALAASAIKSWNFFHRKLSNNNLCQLSYSQLKVLIKKHFSILTITIVVPLFQTDFKRRRKSFLAYFFSFNLMTLLVNHMRDYFFH